MYTQIYNVSKNTCTWAHDVDAESVDVEVTDTGELVTVLEWVGCAYSTGEQQALHDCTLYTDNKGNYYTNFDGELDSCIC